MHQDTCRTVLEGYVIGSLKNLHAADKQYNAFCQRYNLVPFPASPAVLTMFAQHLSTIFKSAHSVQNYVSAMRTLHRLRGHKQNVDSTFWHTSHDRGLRKQMMRPVKQALPITPELLLQMSKFVSPADDEQLVAWTAILLGFHLFLRKSNLVPDSAQSFNPARQFTRAHVQLHAKVALLTITWSKTIQFQQRHLQVPIVTGAHYMTCPLSWLHTMVSQIPAPPSAPLFSLRSGRALTYARLTHWLKFWVSQTGISSHGFSSHSLRQGGATWAFRAGIPDLMIKTLGDWASDAYLRYLDVT